MSVLSAVKEIHIGEEYVMQAHARIGSVYEIDAVAKRPLEDAAADEKVHAEDLKLAVEIESESLGR